MALAGAIIVQCLPLQAAQAPGMGRHGSRALLWFHRVPPAPGPVIVVTPPSGECLMHCISCQARWYGTSGQAPAPVGPDMSSLPACLPALPLTAAPQVAAVATPAPVVSQPPLIVPQPPFVMPQPPLIVPQPPVTASAVAVAAAPEVAAVAAPVPVPVPVPVPRPVPVPPPPPPQQQVAVMLHASRFTSRYSAFCSVSAVSFQQRLFCVHPLTFFPCDL